MSFGIGTIVALAAPAVIGAIDAGVKKRSFKRK
jgi:hypothetical protein